jgi:phosphatidylserine decarboxylase
MRGLRRGSAEGAPHEILDPRDLKYCGNRCDARWPAECDPFFWRERIPLARWGLAEVILMGVPLGLLAAALLAAGGLWRWFALLPAAALALVVSFFRDPVRRVPQEEGIVVSPADGTVIEVSRLEREPFLEGPAVRVSIFLSLFNVHINRVPEDCRVVWLRYDPGRFLNAMRPESARLNESMTIGLQQSEAPYGRMVVRQVSGLVARRIVCCLRPGQWLQRGEKFGMIKFGSRTELYVRSDAWDVSVVPGTRVRAGSSVVARARAFVSG